MSGEDPKGSGLAGGKFVWLAQVSAARNGRTLITGAVHEADDFKPAVVAEWIRTGAARPATSEDLAWRPSADNLYKAAPYEDLKAISLEEYRVSGPFWPKRYYHDGAFAESQPELFPNPPFGGQEKEDAAELEQLRDRLRREGFPPGNLLKRQLTEKQIERLYDYPGMTDILQDALLEIMAGGDSRAARIKWFWFINVLHEIIFSIHKIEWADAEHAEDQRAGRKQKKEILRESLRQACSLFGFQITSLAEPWTGEKSFIAIAKLPGVKIDARIWDLIENQIPLRADGFILEETKSGSVWRKQYGRRQVELTMPKVYAGDIHKRAMMALSKIAGARGTLFPGPIKFGEILETIGELNCNQETRERIREHLISLENAGVKITEKNEKGKEIYHESARFLKRLRWIGGTEQGAIFFPVFNEEFGRALQAAGQYIWIPNERLEGLPAGPEWDRFLLDYFRRHLGKAKVSRKMMAFLLEDAQFNPDTLDKWELKKIDERVRGWFDLAKGQDLIRGYRISPLAKRREYLAQTIFFYPTAAARKRAKIHKGALMQLLDEIITWIYDPANEQHVEKEPEETRQQLKNKIYGIGRPVEEIRAIWEGLLEERAPDYVWDGNQSVFMEFWDRLRALAAMLEKEDEAKGKRK